MPQRRAGPLRSPLFMVRTHANADFEHSLLVPSSKRAKGLMKGSSSYLVSRWLEKRLEASMPTA